MRTLLLTLVLIVAAAALAPAAAQTYPWCAQYGLGRGDGGTNCGFVTLAQCQATVSGIGGFCYQNPWYTPPPKKARVRKKG